jgi:hypothetical protein
MAAKKKSGKSYGNKTAFVLGLPRDLSAKEVVAKGKAQGIVLSEAHVYKIRSTAKSKGGPAARSSTSSSSAAKASSGGSSASSKRDFVLGFPAGTPAAEILAKAKTQGIGLSKAYLYTIRSSAGVKGTGKRGRPAGSGAGAARVSVSGRGQSALETQLIDAALELGLSRATELLASVRNKLKGM